MRGPGAATITRRAATAAPPLVVSEKPSDRRLDPVHAHARPQSTRVEPRDERLDQLDEPAAQRVERRGRLGAGRGLRPRRRPQPPHQAAVHPLQLPKAREGREDREPLGIACVDAGEQRLAQALHGLLPEAPAQERRDRLVAVAVLAGDQDVEAHAQLARPGEEAAREEGQDLRRHREHHPLGQRVELSPVQDEDRALVGVRGDQALAEAELAAQRDRLGLLRQHRVGSALEQEAVPRLGADHPAEALPRLEQDVGHLLLVEGERGRESGDAAADDRDRRVRHEFRS